MKKTFNHPQTIDIFPVSDNSELSIPFVDEGIRAGFPSPATDYVEEAIDLNKYLIRDKPATFLARVSGDSMYQADLADGDIAIIDRSLTPKDGDKVVACINGEFTFKTVRIVTKGKQKSVYLVPANPDYKPIEIQEDDSFLIWGVVTYVIKKMRN